MSQTVFDRFEVFESRHGLVPCATVRPRDACGPLPLCLFLYGGGGSWQSLADIEPLLARWWTEGVLPPMLVATPDVGPWSFYLDDPARGLGWETFVAERFLTHLAKGYELAAHPIGVVGISMGGYGALKLTFARPAQFAAVAAISPMIEPAASDQPVRPRNRYHYPSEVPAALLGEERDETLVRNDHPALRAAAHVEALRQSSLAIYLDAAGADALHAHDGAEHLHRVLWQLDVAHEYRLRRDADHIGPDLIARLSDAFAWVGARLVPALSAPLTEEERAWEQWLEGSRREPAPAPVAPTSVLFPRIFRAQLEPAWQHAAEHDETMMRRYGLLPPLD